MSAPRALLLDFDGVIADTENVHVAAWQRTLGAMGWEVSDEVCARAVEVDDRVFLSGLFTDRKISDGNVDGWVLRKQELTLSLLKDSPRVFPGVIPLIERVKAMGTVKLAVVTTTWRENVATVLTAVGLFDAFDVIVGKEDVTGTKPDPAPYCLAVERLGVCAGDAVAIEDSFSGLRSAEDAGVRSVALGHTRPIGPWIGDSPFLSDLRETDSVLSALGFDPSR